MEHDPYDPPECHSVPIDPTVLCAVLHRGSPLLQRCVQWYENRYHPDRVRHWCSKSFDRVMRLTASHLLEKPRWVGQVTGPVLTGNIGVERFVQALEAYYRLPEEAQEVALDAYLVRARLAGLRL